jgi:hypothetical protein
MIADAFLAFLDVPLAWLGYRVLWALSFGRVGKQSIADLLLLRKLRAGRAFAVWLLAIVVGLGTVTTVICALVLLGPIPSVHEWRGN